MLCVGRASWRLCRVVDVGCLELVCMSLLMLRYPCVIRGLELGNGLTDLLAIHCFLCIAPDTTTPLSPPYIVHTTVRIAVRPRCVTLLAQHPRQPSPPPTSPHLPHTMAWLPWSSSAPDAGGVKKTSGGAFESPSRTNRKMCYEARDSFFECLDKNNILDSINTKSGRAKAETFCSQLDKDFEKNCAHSWVRMWWWVDIEYIEEDNSRWR